MEILVFSEIKYQKLKSKMTNENVKTKKEWHADLRRLKRIFYLLLFNLFLNFDL